MPAEVYYCPDNFFKKMTDLESPRKNNDCYFYYYSTCAKGDSCTFRHEPSALGCETMCSFWKEGKCLNVHCNFRHMELRKNRKVIPCYWESQPGGCLKPHCPFMHQGKVNQDGSDKSDIKPAKTNSERVVNDQPFKNSPVDSLVVNFEEESDNESISTFSPTKNPNRIVKVKTLEEIKLEQIQQESAAFYSYGGEHPERNVNDLRKRILDRLNSKTNSHLITKRTLNSDDDTIKHKKYKKNEPNVEGIKVKTLDEIRAERNKQYESEDNSFIESENKNIFPLKSSKRKNEEAEVSSTSTDESTGQQHVCLISNSMMIPKKKIKLRRKLISDENVVSNSAEEQQEIIVPEDEHLNVKETLLCKQKFENIPNIQLVRNDLNKTMDETLLLQDDDDDDVVSDKAEDILLNEIDNLLDD